MKPPKRPSPAQERANAEADASNTERTSLLVAIYSVADLTDAGMLTTPLQSAKVRREAALALIERDGAVVLVETTSGTEIGSLHGDLDQLVEAVVIDRPDGASEPTNVRIQRIKRMACGYWCAAQFPETPIWDSRAQCTTP